MKIDIKFGKEYIGKDGEIILPICQFERFTHQYIEYKELNYLDRYNMELGTFDNFYKLKK